MKNEVSDHQDVELLLESFGMQLEAHFFSLCAADEKTSNVQSTLWLCQQFAIENGHL